MTKCLAEGNLKGDQFTWAHSVRGTARWVAKPSQSECEAAACDVSMDQEAQCHTKTRARSYPSNAQLSDPLLQGMPHTNSQTVLQARIRFSIPWASGRTLCVPTIKLPIRETSIDDLLYVNCRLSIRCGLYFAKMNLQFFWTWEHLLANLLITVLCQHPIIAFKLSLSMSVLIPNRQRKI